MRRRWERGAVVHPGVGDPAALRTPVGSARRGRWPPVWAIRCCIRPVVDRVLPSRALLALLFTDIVGSTSHDRGDGRPTVACLARSVPHGRARGARQIRRARGQHGRGCVLCTFPRPLDALRAAWAIRSAVRKLGLGARTSLHLGEVEMRGEQVSGLTVHTAARVMAAAGDGEISYRMRCAT